MRAQPCKVKRKRALPPKDLPRACQPKPALSFLLPQISSGVRGGDPPVKHELRAHHTR